MYSAGYTEDLRRAVAHVRASRPQAGALTAAGYSLGASYLAKYVCEEGDRCVLAGAALFACMTDLVAGIARLSDSAAARHGQTAQLAAATAATLPRQDPTPRACSGRPDPLGPRGEPSPRACQRVNCGSALLPAHSRLTHRLGPCRRHGWSTRVCSQAGC